MKKETRTVVYDDELRMEAYRFEGIVQPFPSHFHEHYVIGFVENGERVLSCRDREYAIEEGSIVLFNPGDSHACVQSDEGTFDYRGFNISKEVMLDLAEEVTGKRELPGFSRNVICDEEIACHLHPLHEMVMKGTGEFKKEETLLFLLSYLIQNYGKPFESCIPECRQEIEKACEYMTAHFTERIYLDQMTNEESREVQTETLTIKARPLASGYVKAKTGNKTSAETYANWYKSVYLPEPKAVDADMEGQG